MVGGSGFLLVWTFAISPEAGAAATSGPFAHDMVPVAIDLLVLSVVAGLARRTPRAHIGGALLFVLAATAATAGDLLHLLVEGAGSGPADAGRLGAWVVAAAAAGAAAFVGPSGVWASAPPEGRQSSYTRAPHVLVGATCIVVVATVVGGRPVDPALGLVGASLIAALVAQMLVLLRENASLYSGLAVQASRISTFLQRSSDVIVVCDLDGTVQYVSPALREVFGYDAEEVGDGSLFQIVHPDDVRAVRRRLQELLDGEPSVLVRCRLRHADGSWRVAESTASTLLEDGLVTGMIFNARDVTDRIVLERELAHRATHDELTDLANRRHFTDHLAEALRREHDGTRVAVLYMDLDGFKAVNDTAGHGAGDLLLAEAARRLTGELRGGDLVARFGGDEFAAVLEDVHPDAALAVAARLRAAVSRPYLVDGREVVVRASVGVAFASPGITVGELLRNADLAMYRAKATGRDRVEVYAPQLHADLMRRVDLEGRLRTAMQRGDFVLQYQPVVDLSDGSVPGVEALLRWRRDDGTLASPAEFIDVAEECGLVVPLGRWVLDEALGQLCQWRGEGLDVRMSVNLSTRQLAEPTIVDEVLEALDQRGLPPEVLTLEITESALVDSFESSSRRLAALRSAGVVVALDDFGTGYSGLSYLRGLSVDVLKLDRSFVGGLGHDHERTVLVRAILGLGRDLGLLTVAEGAETPDQVALLQSMGCQQAQGYLFARPDLPGPTSERVRAGFGAALLALGHRAGPVSASGTVVSKG
jgi:diguanylate cyclase (GGDEF)-like protein/PAS domain S-box-containing protein